MYIYKSDFMNFIRCDNFVKLHQFKKNLLSKEEILKEEIFSDLTDLEVNDDYVNALLPYYTMVEDFALKKSEVIFRKSSVPQKKFESVLNSDINLVCYSDIYIDNEFLIEVKATTKNTFLNLGSKGKSIFTIKDDVYYLKDELNLLDFEVDKYNKQKEVLFNPFSNCGHYIYDLAFQRYVIENNSNNNLKELKYYLAVLDSDYVFDGENYDYKKIICFFDFTNVTKILQESIKKDLDKILYNLNSNNKLNFMFTKKCMYKQTYECKYLKKCNKFLTTKHPITAYIDNHLGFSKDKISVYDLVNEYKITNMFDIDESFLTREKNIIQRNCLVEDKEYINIDKIKYAIDKIKYPIYHLDFESFPCPIPRFKGEKCYSQSVFQYSLHIEYSDNNIVHYSYLVKDKKDHRKELVSKLIEDLGEEGTILVYNEVFEKGRIKEFISYFPEYEKELTNILDRVYDLLFVLKGNTNLYKDTNLNDSLFNYYHSNLDGSFSIKKVLPVFTDLSYKDLNIKNGNEAIIAYASMKDKFDDFTYNSLLEYCHLDTYSMILILSGIKNKICYNR